MKNSIQFLLCSLCCWSLFGSIKNFDPSDILSIPHITINFTKTPQQKFVILSNHFDANALFNLFNLSYVNERLLPVGIIEPRLNNNLVSGKQLIQQVQELLQEILDGKKKFTHFAILKKMNFNFSNKCGLIVLKFNDFPFVVKLFRETAESFSQPFSKGWEQFLFYLMGGGVNRHLMGFTRIKNLEWIHQKIKNDSYWSANIEVPRKWFWIPSESSWITIVGNNIDNKLNQAVDIPGTYAIIADYMETKRYFSILNRRDRKIALELCNFLEMRIDPNTDNFMIGTNDKTILVDTEHFPTLFGLKKRYQFSNFLSYYYRLFGKMIKDVFKFVMQEKLNEVGEMRL